MESGSREDRAEGSKDLETVAGTPQRNAPSRRCQPSLQAAEPASAQGAALEGLRQQFRSQGS